MELITAHLEAITGERITVADIEHSDANILDIWIRQFALISNLDHK